VRTSEAEAFAQEASTAEAAPKPPLREVSQRLLRELSETFVHGAHQVATEGDHWFMTTVRGLNRGAEHTKLAAHKLGRYLRNGASKLTPSFLAAKTQRERIRSALLREAKHAKLSGKEFEAFSEQIAILVELVLQGRIQVSDIAFEHAESLRSDSPDCTSNRQDAKSRQVSPGGI
jgi:hypothetical protein